MTRFLAAAVVAVALSAFADSASAQYPYGGFYGGYANVFVPQPAYGYYAPSYGSYYNNYGYSNGGYAYRSNYGYRRSFHNPSHSHGGCDSGPPTTVQLPGGGSITGNFKNVITLPPGATVSGF